MIKYYLFVLLLIVNLCNVFAQTSSLKKAILRGKIIYQQNCLACHQEDGSGVRRLNPPLIKTAYVLGDPKKLSSIVLNGLNEEIEIDGEYYSNPMPAFGTVLKDNEIADVLTFIRNNFGNKASLVTATTVAAVRATGKK